MTTLDLSKSARLGVKLYPKNFKNVFHDKENNAL